MTKFEITINDTKETVKAKYLGNGEYKVRRLKTCNFAQVEYIETMFGNDGQKQFRIKSFYPSSKYAYMDNVDQKVKLMKKIQPIIIE